MILVDTGFWLALANAQDHYHQRAVNFLKKNKQKLITTWPVMTETSHLLLSRLGIQASLTFIQTYQLGAFEIYEPLHQHAPRLTKLMHKYQDLPMDLADASLIILAEELGSGLILSTDLRDFQTYKWKNHKPFQNLLIPEFA